MDDPDLVVLSERVAKLEARMDGVEKGLDQLDRKVSGMNSKLWGLLAGITFIVIEVAYLLMR